jgi:hypothetical protein
MLTLVRRLRLITYPAWPRATPFVRASLFRGSCFCVSILTKTSLQNAWSFRERARLARRNSVSTRLMAFSVPNRVTSSSTHTRGRA